MTIEILPCRFIIRKYRRKLTCSECEVRFYKIRIRKGQLIHPTDVTQSCKIGTQTFLRAGKRSLERRDFKYNITGCSYKTESEMWGFIFRK